ncbi:hypothetical protein AURDEDRAFT_174366 [Auricularia subglabra TFB-10046 SS5]|nr:hypothetical protein AURDEDRAFT_174366 [Auricularia subglabra TFB-10046 SS5]
MVPDHHRAQMSQAHYDRQSGYAAAQAAAPPIYPGNAFPVDSTPLAHGYQPRSYPTANIPPVHVRSPAMSPMVIADPRTSAHAGYPIGFGPPIYPGSNQQSFSHPAAFDAPPVSPSRPKTRNPHLDPGPLQPASQPFPHRLPPAPSLYPAAPAMVPISPYQPRAYKHSDHGHGGYVRRPSTPAEQSPYFRPLREGESLLLTPFHPKGSRTDDDDFEDDDDDESLDYDFTSDAEGATGPSRR